MTIRVFWLMFIIPVLGILLLSLWNPMSEVKIKNINFKGFETQIEKEGIQSVLMEQSDFVGIEKEDSNNPIDSKPKFLERISPSKSPYLIIIKNDHVLKKIYFIIVKEGEEKGEIKKYIEEFSYTEYTKYEKKFRLGDYKPQNNGESLVTFYYYDSSEYDFAVFITGILFVPLAISFFSLICIYSISFMIGNKFEEKRDEDKEDKEENT